MKNLNDGVEQNDKLSLEAVRFAWGTTPIAWEKIRQPPAKNRLALNVPRGDASGSQGQNEGLEESNWNMMGIVSATLAAAIKRLIFIASSLSGALGAWNSMATHFQPSNTHEENAR